MNRNKVKLNRGKVFRTKYVVELKDNDHLFDDSRVIDI